jgi:hypothetical protein
MERLSNSVSMVLQLCKPVNLKNFEGEEGTFSETSVRTRATWYKAPDDILSITSMFWVQEKAKQAASK